MLFVLQNSAKISGFLADATTAATTAAAAAAADAKPAEGEAQADHKPADSEQKVSGQQLEDHGAHDAASKDAVPAGAAATGKCNQKDFLSIIINIIKIN